MIREGAACINDLISHDCLQIITHIIRPLHAFYAHALAPLSMPLVCFIIRLLLGRCRRISYGLLKPQGIQVSPTEAFNVVEFISDINPFNVPRAWLRRSPSIAATRELVLPSHSASRPIVDPFRPLAYGCSLCGPFLGLSIADRTITEAFHPYTKLEPFTLQSGSPGLEAFETFELLLGRANF